MGRNPRVGEPLPRLGAPHLVEDFLFTRNWPEVGFPLISIGPLSPSNGREIVSWGRSGLLGNQPVWFRGP
jgi:hypothetical protein